jgi:hypothetical protein
MERPIHPIDGFMYSVHIPYARLVNLEHGGGCPKKHNPLLHPLESEIGDWVERDSQQPFHFSFPSLL